MFERPARTAFQRWWWVAPPGVVGSLLAAMLFASSLSMYQPVKPHLMECTTEAALVTEQRCIDAVEGELNDMSFERVVARRRAEAEAAKPSGERMERPAETVPARDSAEAVSLAKERVLDEATSRLERFEKYYGEYEANYELANLQRLGAVGSLLGGALLSLLTWWIGRRFITFRRRVELSAHALTVDDRRILFSQIEHFELGPEEDGYQRLRVTPKTGKSINVRLPVMLGQGERLEALLERVMPSDEDRESERDHVARIRREAADLIGR